MQGSYLPGKERAKLALQGRKSHFVFGNSANEFSTTQKSFFKAFVPSRSPQTNSKNRTISHFNLGSDPTHKSSEFTSNYRAHSLEGKNPILKIADLTPSSVVMGMQQINFTTSNNVYKSHQVNYSGSNTNSPQKNRKHNFDLGKDEDTKFSVMHADFSPVKTEKPKKIEKALLNSHIVMGGHPSMYKSIAATEFSSKGGNPGNLGEEKVKDLKSEHFLLGKDETLLVSNQQQSYRPLIIPKQGLTQEQLTNLKSSHFRFSAENPDYITSNKLHMNYTPAESRAQEKYLKENHVVLGNDSAKYNTNYVSYHTFRSQSVNQPVRTKNEEMNSSVVLGTTNADLSITSATFMTGKKGSPGKLDPRLEKNLRGHHYNLGNSTNIYEQSHKNYGVGPPNPSKFNNLLQEDMNSTH